MACLCRSVKSFYDIDDIFRNANAKDFIMVYRMMYLQDGEAYAYLLSALAPEHSSTTMIETTDPKERAKKVLETAEKLDCTRYVTSKDINEGSANLNLAFVAQIFQQRY